MKFVDPGCRWCSDDDGDQECDVGSPFLRLRKTLKVEKEKVKDMHIPDKDKTIITISLSIMTKIKDNDIIKN